MSGAWEEAGALLVVASGSSRAKSDSEALQTAVTWGVVGKCVSSVGTTRVKQKLLSYSTSQSLEDADGFCDCLGRVYFPKLM